MARIEFDETFLEYMHKATKSKGAYICKQLVELIDFYNEHEEELVETGTTQSVFSNEYLNKKLVPLLLVPNHKKYKNLSSKVEQYRKRVFDARRECLSQLEIEINSTSRRSRPKTVYGMCLFSDIIEDFLGPKALYNILKREAKFGLLNLKKSELNKNQKIIGSFTDFLFFQLQVAVYMLYEYEDSFICSRHFRYGINHLKAKLWKKPPVIDHEIFDASKVLVKIKTLPGSRYGRLNVHYDGSLIRNSYPEIRIDTQWFKVLLEVNASTPVRGRKYTVKLPDNVPSQKLAKRFSTLVKNVRNVLEFKFPELNDVHLIKSIRNSYKDTHADITFHSKFEIEQN